jgi:hypothetical protein
VTGAFTEFEQHESAAHPLPACGGPEDVQERIRAALRGGMSVRKTAARFKVNPPTVQRISRLIFAHARVAHGTRRSTYLIFLNAICLWFAYRNFVIVRSNGGPVPLMGRRR